MVSGTRTNHQNLWTTSTVFQFRETPDFFMGFFVTTLLCYLQEMAKLPQLAQRGNAVHVVFSNAESKKK
jgi:hypothetical protein